MRLREHHSYLLSHHHAGPYQGGAAPPVRKSLRLRSAMSSSGRCDREQDAPSRRGTCRSTSGRFLRRSERHRPERPTVEEVGFGDGQLVSPEFAKRSLSTANSTPVSALGSMRLDLELRVRLLGEEVGHDAGQGLHLGGLALSAGSFQGSSG